MEHVIGGAPQVVARGWTTRADIDRLTASANHPGISGDAARPARMRGTPGPDRAMSVSTPAMRTERAISQTRQVTAFAQPSDLRRETPPRLRPSDRASPLPSAPKSDIVTQPEGRYFSMPHDFGTKRPTVLSQERCHLSLVISRPVNLHCEYGEGILRRHFCQGIRLL